MAEPTNPKQPKQQQAQIKADEKELLGQYANLVVDSSQRRRIHAEFYLFVSQRAAGQAGGQHYSESVARKTPAAQALKENVARFEAQFGTLPEGSGGPMPDTKLRINPVAGSAWRNRGDHPLGPLGLDKFQADREAGFGNELAIGDARHRAERTGQSRQWSVVRSVFQRRVVSTRAPRKLTFSVKVVSVPGSAGGRKCALPTSIGIRASRRGPTEVFGTPHPESHSVPPLITSKPLYVRSEISSGPCLSCDTAPRSAAPNSFSMVVPSAGIYRLADAHGDGRLLTVAPQFARRCARLPGPLLRIRIPAGPTQIRRRRIAPGVSMVRLLLRKATPSRLMARLPVKWPYLSLIFFRPSRSKSRTAKLRPVRLER